MLLLLLLLPYYYNPTTNYHYYSYSHSTTTTTTTTTTDTTTTTTTNYHYPTTTPTTPTATTQQRLLLPLLLLLLNSTHKICSSLSALHTDTTATTPHTLTPITHTHHCHQKLAPSHHSPTKLTHFNRRVRCRQKCRWPGGLGEHTKVQLGRLGAFGRVVCVCVFLWCVV